MNYPTVFSIQHYTKNKKDTIDVNQKLHKLFLDIEVIADGGGGFDFDQIDQGKHSISCVTIFSSNEKVFHVFVLLNKKCVETWSSCDDHIDYFKKKIVELDYMDEGTFDIKLKTYTSDLPLIKDCWDTIHKLDPVVLTGFNSDGFDFPYIYYRLKHLYNGDLKSVSKVLSRFGDVSISNYGGGRGKVGFIEYVNMDIQYLFKPRDDNGLNLGFKLPSYSLDFVGEAVLKKKKLDFKNQNLSLDQFYIQDPLNYVLYNIIDVGLCVLLDRKLGMIDQYNMYRRLMHCNLSEALRGSTALFDSLVLYNLTKKGEYVRFGLNDETVLTISKDEIDKIHKPLSKKNIKWNLQGIDQRTYLKITRKFEGAYVKDSPGRVYDQEDGLIIDLDATSLYPSMIKQNNISFDTYFGRVLDPVTTSSAILLLDELLKDKKSPKIKSVHNQFLDLCVNYIESDKITVTNKGDATQQYYIVVSYLFNKIINSNAKSVKEIFQPDSFYNYILLKKYVIPFLNLIDEIHVNNNFVEFNSFCYSYLLSGEIEHKSIYVIENINQPTLRIVQIIAETLDSYLKKNELILTLTGCLFYKHEKKVSLFFEWLVEMYKMRKLYIHERGKYSKDSDEYSFFNSRQSATKVAMNTSYGLYGQSTFRYSNNWLAKTITCQGRLSLKISQQIAEEYLKNYKGQ